MQINLNELGEKTVRFLEEYKSVLVNAGLVIGIGVVCKKCGINISEIYSFPEAKILDTKKTIDIPDAIFTRNSKENAIRAIYKNACKMSWDSDRERAVKQIYDLLKEETDDATKSFGISILSDISERMTWSSGKDSVLRYITKLASN